ncbi:MAG: DNA-binding response regulator, partial [Pseudonocardiales bacterium]
MAGPSILVIEDDHELRGILLRALDEHGFAPTGAATGAEALTRVGDPAPDALVIDIGLPD